MWDRISPQSSPYSRSVAIMLMIQSIYHDSDSKIVIVYHIYILDVLIGVLK